MKPLIVFILVIYAFASSVCGDCGFSYFAPDPDNVRIIHGVEAKKGAWPWMVPLLWNNTHDNVGVFVRKCGATIINEQWLVTAAHCFDYRGGDGELASVEKDYVVEAGEHELNTKSDDTDGFQSVTHEIELIRRHEKYDGQYRPHDIALLKVKRPISYNKRVLPICIPDTDDEYDELETQCYAAGWGEDQGTAENPEALQQIHSEIINLEACKAVHGSDGAVHDKSVCFGDGRKGTCTNDSGGPLMCKRLDKWFLVGITSWGHKRCIDLPGVFTKVAAHHDWILDEISKN